MIASANAIANACRVGPGRRLAIIVPRQRWTLRIQFPSAIPIEQKIIETQQRPHHPSGKPASVSSVRDEMIRVVKEFGRVEVTEVDGSEYPVARHRRHQKVGERPLCRDERRRCRRSRRRWPTCQLPHRSPIRRRSRSSANAGTISSTRKPQRHHVRDGLVNRPELRLARETAGRSTGPARNSRHVDSRHRGRGPSRCRHAGDARSARSETPSQPTHRIRELCMKLHRRRFEDEQRGAEGLDAADVEQQAIEFLAIRSRRRD